MAEYHYTFQVTAPANTLSSSPVEVMTAFEPGWVELVEIRWPRGHASLTGIRIAFAHQPIVPLNSGGWILGDDMTRIYTPRHVGDSGQWSVWLYNADFRDHYWQVTYDVIDSATEKKPTRQLPVDLPASVIHDAAGARRLVA